MLSLASTIAISPFILPAVAAGAFAIGVAASCVAYKVIPIAINIFKKMAEWTKETFFVRVKSMGCAECAKTHKEHFKKNPIDINLEKMCAKQLFE